jgi:sec-independent protein translocase protein TatA
MIFSELFAMGLPGVGEMAILAFIILLLFGGAKLPKLMRDLGSSAKEFKRGMAETDDEADLKEKKD